MSSNKNHTILIAEDDSFLIKAMTDKLEREKFNVIKASDGQEAIKQIKTKKPDLLLLDLIMPVMDGFETLKEIKKLKMKKKPIIIVLSNLGQDSDIEEATKLGAYDYLIKSNFSINKITEKVKETLAKIK